jgi:chloramphenicol-sensitive protein RarD
VNPASSDAPLSPTTGAAGGSPAPVELDRRAARGSVAALAAFLGWGAAPIYFHHVGHIPLLEVMAHRALWSLVLVLIAIGVSRRFHLFGEVLRRRRSRRLLFGSTLLITLVWGVFIWAVSHHRVLDVSLGYYVSPLISVLLGVIFLRERLSRLEVVGAVLVAIGVVNLSVPWVGILLALGFAAYGLLRKLAAVDPLVGLAIETGLLTPFAVGFLAWTAVSGGGMFGTRDLETDILLIASGPVTALPLLLFAQGVRYLKLSTVGMMQYITPSFQLGLAVLLWHENFTRTHAISYALIGPGLGLFAFASRRRAILAAKSSS